MSRSGNQYVYSIEINKTLEHVYRNRRTMESKLRYLLDKHKDEGWTVVQNTKVAELFINLRAKGVKNAIYRNILLTMSHYGNDYRKQIIVKCWVIKSERIT
jgi:hypothetical protein